MDLRITSKSKKYVLAAALLLAVITPVYSGNPLAPPSLKTVPVPVSPQIGQFVKNKPIAIMLGKALFWDMQVGSDGVQACASCHFHAGADSRVKNQINPGLNGQFDIGGPNYTLRLADFPFHRKLNMEDRDSPVIFDIDDICSSQGVPGFDFNGVDPFGKANPNARVFKVVGGSVQMVPIEADFLSLASQAVGPPMSPLEMSFAGRDFMKLGKKVLRLKALGKQKVHPQDSVLASFADTSADGRGLRITYADLIKLSFRPEYWNSTQVIKVVDGVPTVINRPNRPLEADEYTLM